MPAAAPIVRCGLPSTGSLRAVSASSRAASRGCRTAHRRHSVRSVRFPWRRLPAPAIRTRGRIRATRVDAPGARALPGFARAMQGLQRLLLDRFHRHRLDIAGPGRLQQRCRVGRISLVALHVGAHVLGRQQLYFDASLPEQASPVVGRNRGKGAGRGRVLQFQATQCAACVGAAIDSVLSTALQIVLAARSGRTWKGCAKAFTNSESYVRKSS